MHNYDDMNRVEEIKESSLKRAVWQEMTPEDIATTRDQMLPHLSKELGIPLDVIRDGAVIENKKLVLIGEHPDTMATGITRILNQAAQLEKQAKGIQYLTYAVANIPHEINSKSDPGTALYQEVINIGWNAGIKYEQVADGGITTKPIDITPEIRNEIINAAVTNTQLIMRDFNLEPIPNYDTTINTNS